MKTTLTKLDIAACGGFMMFAISGVVTPICLPEISKTLSTSFSEGGGMETARTVLVLLTLMVAGICARHWGKKIFITYGQYFLALGLMLTSYADSYTLLIMALMITGIGGGFTEALINPLVVDLHSEDSGKYLNIANAFYPIGVMAGALIFGELLTLGYSWRLMFRIAGIGALIMGVLFHISRFPTPIEEEHSSAHVISNILRQPGFWLFAAAIFFGAGVESSFTFWSRSYVETYLADVPRAGAIAVVIFAGTMAIGRLLSARLSELMSLKALMMSSAILGVLVSSAILFTNSLIAFYILLALAGFAAACFWPTILAEADACLSVDTTMLFVMLACFGIAGFGLTPLIMGAIGDSAGLKSGFLVIPVLFIGLILVITLERRIPSKKTPTIKTKQ